MLDKKYKITLEDNGQDLLTITTDSKGMILECFPYHTSLYAGGYIPIRSQKIGEKCMIYKPPTINFGFLKYKVEKIEEINNKKPN